MSYKLRGLVALSLFLWMSFILFLSLSSHSNAGLVAEKWLGRIPNEVGHLGEYAILGLLIYSLFSFYLSSGINMLTSLIFCGLFSFLDESVQSMNPNRTPEVKDIIFDNIGSSGAMLCIALLKSGLKFFYMPSVPSKL